MFLHLVHCQNKMKKITTLAEQLIDTHNTQVQSISIKSGGVKPIL
jgi:hypothetical protein